MVAEGRMDSRHEGDALVERGGNVRQEAPLAAACHADGLAIPLRQRGDVVDRPYTAHDDALVVALVAVVHAEVPVIVESTVHQIVVESLRLGDVHAMDAYFEDDGLGGRGIGVAAVGTHTGSRHAQQGRIASGPGRHRQDAVGARAPAQVLETDLVDVHVLTGTLGQQRALRAERGPAGFLQRLCPEGVKVLRLCRGRFQLLRREGRRTGTVILLAADLGHHLQPVEAGLTHGARPGHRTVLQHGGLLHIGIHLRPGLVCHLHII